MYGITFTRNPLINPYPIYFYGKQSRINFPLESGYSTKHLLNLIHNGICGPMYVPSYCGYLYFVTFIANASRWKILIFFEIQE